MSGWLSSRLTTAHVTVELAVGLFESASAVPRTETRKSILLSSNISIDGDFVVPGAQTATFLRAFANGKVAKVLKIPYHHEKVEHECLLFSSLKSSITAEINLVPVEVLPLVNHGVIYKSPTKNYQKPTKGILMPFYANTLANVPAPMKADYALEVLNLMESAINFIHRSRWLHGDVKPSNIFLTVDGTPWLGDYGSCCQYASIAGYTGGTPCYQCVDFYSPNATDATRFDKIGLVLSLLDRLDIVNTAAPPLTTKQLSQVLKEATTLPEPLRNKMQEMLL